jgi:transposase
VANRALPHRALARPVQHQLRCAALRSDQHLFEADPPFAESDKRRHGYSRDHRPDCVQVVIALVVTPEGLPLAYEALLGNTADNTTLRDFLARIER